MDSLETAMKTRVFEDNSKTTVVTISPIIKSEEWYPENPNNRGKFSPLNSSPLVLLKDKEKLHEILAIEKQKEIFNSYFKYYTYVDERKNQYYIVDKSDSHISFRRNLYLGKKDNPIVKVGWNVWLIYMDYKEGSKTCRSEMDLVGS